MSLWIRQQVSPVAAASIAGLLIGIAASRCLLSLPSPRILKAPESSEEKLYRYNLYEGGNTIETPYGRLRYYLLGPTDGKKVLLIHGISTPCPVWHRIVSNLVGSGHRVLCYDLIGRGYSDGPANLQYNASLYISQLCMLLTAIPDWSGSFNIIGYSMGATVATSFTNCFPNRVDKLLLFAPAGLIKSHQLPYLESFIRLGYLPISFAQSLLLNGTAKSQFLSYTDLIKWQSKQHEGFLHSFTSSLTNDMLWDLHHLYQSVQDQFGSRMQAIWGDKDVTCPLEGAESIKGLKVHIIKDGRHDMIAQLPFSDEVAQLTIEFLSSA